MAVTKIIGACLGVIQELPQRPLARAARSWVKRGAQTVRRRTCGGTRTLATIARVDLTMSKLPATVVLFINTFSRKPGWAVTWLHCVSIELQPHRPGRHEAFSAYAPLRQRIVIDGVEPIFPARGLVIWRINMPMALNIGRILIAALYDRPMPNSLKLIDDPALDALAPEIPPLCRVSPPVAEASPGSG
jgi:hypothetical protein